MSAPVNPNAPVRVLLVDDQVYLRRGLRTLLEIEDRIEVVGEARDGLEALGLVPSARPDVALVDARMPRMGGVELTERLSAEHPGVAVIILTTFEDDEYVFGGLGAGARGHLLKDTPPDELVAAIVKVHGGATVLGDAAAQKVASEIRRRPPGPTPGPPAEETGALSEREVEVLGLIGSGVSTREIAQRLYITEGTARNHVSKILRKLGLKDRTQAALYAAEHGHAERGRSGRRRAGD